MTVDSKTEFADGVATIVIDGLLNMYSVKNLKNELLDFLTGCLPDLQKVQIDLQAVAELDSSGIALLAHVQKKANEMGAEFFILRPSAKIRKLFDLGFIDAMFKIVD
ncbi:MAG: STAS domain-containing protein [bacterium]|nr:STAS domain-containing protein [bacterium]